MLKSQRKIKAKTTLSAGWRLSGLLDVHTLRIFLSVGRALFGI